jgi:hypothetical protein
MSTYQIKTAQAFIDKNNLNLSSGICLVTDQLESDETTFLLKYTSNQITEARREDERG